MTITLRRSTIWKSICDVVRIPKPLLEREPNLPRQQLLLVLAYVTALRYEILKVKTENRDLRVRVEILEAQTRRQPRWREVKVHVYGENGSEDGTGIRSARGHLQ